MSEATEIAELRTENAALKAENAELRRPETRRVVQHMPPGFVAPTRPQLGELRRIVLAAFPILAERTDIETFTAAFTAVSFLPRQDALQARYANSVWMDRAATILRRLHWPITDLPFHAFTAAALAHDLDHSVDATRWPTECLFSLGDHVGSAPTGAEWKRVLAAGRVRPATKVEAFEQARRRSGERVGIVPRTPSW
jgi:hypothetical protein